MKDKSIDGPGYTPGPWEIIETAKAHAPNDAWFELTAEAQHLVLAEVYTDDGGVDDRGVTVEAARANARLIASAPALVEALQGLLSVWGHKPGTTSRARHEAFLAAKDVLSTALGEMNDG